jgi:hypothetical protein
LDFSTAVNYFGRGIVRAAIRSVSPCNEKASVRMEEAPRVQRAHVLGPMPTCDRPRKDTGEEGGARKDWNLQRSPQAGKL